MEISDALPLEAAYIYIYHQVLLKYIWKQQKYAVLTRRTPTSQHLRTCRTKAIYPEFIEKNEWPPRTSPDLTPLAVTSGAPCWKSTINSSRTIRRLMSWKPPCRHSEKSYQKNISTRRWRTSQALDCNCNGNWGTCIAPHTRRPRAHYRVNPYLSARRQNETKMFSDHDETSPSIAAVSAPSTACSMLAVQQQKRLCRRRVRGATRLPHDKARSVDRPGILTAHVAVAANGGHSEHLQ